LIAGPPKQSVLRPPLPFFACVALAAPRARLLVCTGVYGNGLALTDRAGRGAAALVASGRPSQAPVRLLTWGTAEPAAELRQIIASWRASGRPALGDLCIRVSYGPRPRRTWRVSHRAQATLAFDWLT
jgi:hypothetical protein